MKVLVVDEEIPFPLNSGKRIRTFNLLKHLAQDNEITFVCRQHEDTKDSSPQALGEQGIQTVVVPHPVRKKSGPEFYLALLANLLSKHPYSVASHYSKLLVDTIGRLMRTGQYDLIHCEWTPYALNLKSIFPYPAVVDAHNVEALIWQRNYEVENHPIKKLYLYLQWKKMLRFEQKAFPLFSQAIAVSEQDKAVIMRWMPENKIDVIFNGVDVDYFKPARVPQATHSIVFTGSLDWRPNVDAMLYFLDEIWPLVLKICPNARLTIVGRRPLPVLKGRVLKSQSVTLTGTVDDVRPYIEKASVCIVPLRIGGGSRLKILEALAMHKPVVSTTIGAEGLDVTPGKNILTADDPLQFAGEIRRLFEDKSLCERLGEAGRHLVESRYQWKVLAERLEKIWIKTSESSRKLN